MCFLRLCNLTSSFKRNNFNDQILKYKMYSVKFKSNFNRIYVSIYKNYLLYIHPLIVWYIIVCLRKKKKHKQSLVEFVTSERCCSLWLPCLCCNAIQMGFSGIRCEIEWSNKLYLESMLNPLFSSMKNTWIKRSN